MRIHAATTVVVVSQWQIDKVREEMGERGH